MSFNQTENLWLRAIKVAWPAVLESVFLSLAGIVDTIMVSSIGAFAVAAVGLTTQPKFFFFTVFLAISVALSALVARRKGQKDKRSANETLLTALILVLILCAVITIFAVVLAEPILRLAGSNTDTHQTSTIYFRIIMGGMIFNIIPITVNAAQRGSGNTKVAFTTNLVSTIVNISFNFLLIEGRFIFPRLGISGAAIATVLGTVVASVMSLASLFKKDSFVSIPFIVKEKLKVSLQALKNIYNLANSISLENIAMRLGFIVTAFMAARLGTTSFAAHNVAMNILSLGFAFANGMQITAVALIGEALGRGAKDLAKSLARVCQRIGFIISIALSLFLFFAGEYIFKLHFNNPEIIRQGIMLSKFVMIIVIAQISQIIYAACLRAAGDVKYTLLVSLISVTIIRSLLTILLVGFLDLGLVGIWLGVLSDQCSRLVCMRLRYKQGNWVHIKI